MRRSVFFLLFISVALSACAQIQQETPKKPDPGTGPFLIGTGSISGVYYALGQEVCRSYDQTVAVESSTCDTMVQRSSETKLRLLQSKILDMAIVHSGWVRSAGNGIGPFTNTGPMNQLRAVMSFYSQPLSVIVKRNSGITKLDQLSTARLIGASGSFADATFRILRNSNEWTDSSFASIEKVKSTRTALDAFCDGQANAMLVTSGHPSGFVQKATAECSGRLLPVDIPEIGEEIAENPALAVTSIPAGMYIGQSESIPTFGHRTLLVARSDTPDVIVEAVVNAVLEDVDGFKQRHPAFFELNADDMATAGLGVALHPAAEAIYRERGFLP